MSAIDDLIQGNQAFVAAGDVHDPASAQPSRKVVVVTCMDVRIDPLAALGLNTGEAHVLRNAGGVVTDDTIRSLAISQRCLGTREVMLIHHTRCGMLAIDEDEFRAELQAAAGASPPFAIQSFADLDTAVRESIKRVRDSPFLPNRDAVRGFVYDVSDGRLREVHTEATG